MIALGHSDSDCAGCRGAQTAMGQERRQDTGEDMGEDPDSTPMTAARNVIAVDVQAAGWRREIPGVEAGVRKTAEAVLRATVDTTMAAGVEVSLVLANDATVRALNRDYRGHDAPTNVLAFPQNEDPGMASPGPESAGPVLLGDVVVALETVLREAAAQGKSGLDHTCHLVAHGLLHLFGFDHQTDAAAADMEHREIAILAGLGIADPYAGGQALDGPADGVRS